MNLTNQTIETTYGNVLTIGTTAGTPTTGTLQNGAGTAVASLDINGSLSVADLTIGNTLTFSGPLNTGPITSTGAISGTTGTFTGAVDGAAGTFSSLRSGTSVEGATGTFTGAHSAASYTATGAGAFGNVTTGGIIADDITANTVINTVELNATGPSALAATTMTDLTATRATIPTFDSTAITATTATIDTITTDNLILTQSTVAANGTTISAATQLTGGISLVSSADASNIAVKLPSALLGTSVKIINTSSRPIKVFPYSATDSVLGLSAGTAYTIPDDGLMYDFICVQNPSVGVWSVTTPSSNNSVRRSVSVSLVADGTHIGANSESISAASLMDLSKTTYYINNNPVYVLNAPTSSMDWFDSPEFNTYNKVKLAKLTLKSNVPAGDLTTSNAQYASTLMGVTSTQLYNCFGYIRTSTRDGATVYNMNDFNTVRFLDHYSALVALGSSTQGFGHYMGSDGNLYQSYEVTLPNNPTWDIKDSNGVRNIYFSPYIGYGSASANTPHTGYPTGFSFEVEVIVDFEFSM